MLALLICISVDFRALWQTALFWWTLPCYYGWSSYLLIVALINLQVVWNRRVVPGANDNLVACVGQLVLAGRLANSLPDDMELVFVVTGSEEAGTGGSLALVRAMRSQWDRGQTVIVNLEGIGDGQVRILEEGDLVHLPAPGWLKQLAREVAAEEGRGELLPFTIPVGATDALPFLIRGYPTITVGCLDPQRGAPRHYHRLSDTPENVDYAQVVDTLNFTERLLRKLSRPAPSAAARLAPAASAEKRDPADPPGLREE
jgi:acetylornithine deacetylase/succinyl-diaminopimelate desuccinylase-like protein